MNDTIKNVLYELVERAKKNKEHEASFDLIGIVNNSDQVRSFTDQLKDEGFIMNINIYGKTHFSCNVTEKAFEYFREEGMK